MKQWLNTPVTYGGVIRILLICIFVFLLFISAIDVAFNIGGPHWTAISATILTVVGIIIGLGQWLVPFPTDKLELTSNKIALELLQKQEESYLKTSTNQETGTLIVSTSKENLKVTVYLLPRGEFDKCKSSKEKLQNNKQKKIGTITRVRFGPHPLFVALFRDLQPGRYNAWIGWGIDNPKSFIVQIDKGVVSELELDWKN